MAYARGAATMHADGMVLGRRDLLMLYSCVRSVKKCTEIARAARTRERAQCTQRPWPFHPCPRDAAIVSRARYTRAVTKLYCTSVAAFDPRVGCAAGAPRSACSRRAQGGGVRGHCTADRAGVVPTPQWQRATWQTRRVRLRGVSARSANWTSSSAGGIESCTGTATSRTARGAPRRSSAIVACTRDKGSSFAAG